ncbi:MAG: translation initiation factor IF-2 [Flavobacteriaceae bacterium]|nr:translation initiation factor IF-2 [Flavobacteriaceae bacterium]|tara:strand:- start:8788 stop:11523 length:2736 start_codon:yes stop_codon:yes gene_type:complete
MADQQSIRLNKALRELNISLDRAVEYLSSQGFEIEARPTTKISNETYKILLDEFETDKSKKDASAEISEEKKKEKEQIRLIQEKKEKEKISNHQTNQEIIKASNISIQKPKQVGKISLEKESQELELKSKTSGLDKNVLSKEDSKDKSLTPDKKTNLEKEEASINIVDKNKDFSKNESDKNQKKVLSDKNNSKDQNLKEDLKIETNYKKLSGPKKTGETINLDQVNEKEKNIEDARKKKRKRINKESPSQFSKNQNLPTNKKGKKNLKQSEPSKIEPSDEEVQKQIRETLEKLQGKSSKSKAAKYRRDKRSQHRQKSEDEQAEQEAQSKIIKVTEFITVGEVATLMEVSSTEIISACMTLGIMVTMNQRLDAETLSIVADEFGYQVEFVKTDLEENIDQDDGENYENLNPRAPIVTVMGHVDHGKTSLLDYIREENVIAGESGGITQHIGAYSVELKDGQKITFLDTPGHEAFTAMRARGAQVTDIAVIVIAADDDIMPQTKEAISHAQAASVPIVFAINKVDKETSNPDKIKESLANMNLMVEEWGGKVQSQDVSAIKGTGISELLEKILLEAELLELKADDNRRAKGTVVEAFLDKGRGYVSTLLVQNGTLKVGDYLLAGKQSGKVKAMFNERGNPLEYAAPSTPVSILGLDGAPQAGDNFNVIKDEREAKQIAAKRTQLLREQNVRTQRHITLDEIGRRIALGEFKELNIILKGDVDGSVEALTDSLQKLSTEEIQVNIVHKGVGAITESDVLLASASDAIVIGFNVRPLGNARTIADKEEIDIRSYSIIYDAINDVKDAMEGMLSPEMREEITGNADVRETFKISKVGTIAGCMVTSGKILRNSGVRVIREGVVLYVGELLSLKRFKEDVKEVSKGFDCGIQIKNYNDIKTEDVLEFYNEVAVKKKL